MCIFTRSDVQRLCGLLLILMVTGCQSLAGGGKVYIIDSEQDGALREEQTATRLSTDLTLQDFRDMADDVAADMLASDRLFRNQDSYKVIIGKVRNLTENERLRVSDLTDQIVEVLLTDPRIRIFKSLQDDQTYAIHTVLKSSVSTRGSAKQVDYELRFELHNFMTDEYLGSWSTQRSYKKTARTLF